MLLVLKEARAVDEDAAVPSDSLLQRMLAAGVSAMHYVSVKLHDTILTVLLYVV